MTGMVLEAALVPAVVVLGLLVGSFLNVVVWRVPRGESVVSPPSACPGCGRPVRPRDNVPVLSWLLLRGRCRDCGGAISVRYPLVEAATALLFGAVALLVGPSWELPALLYLAAVAVALSLIDLDTHRLPDAIVLPSYVVAAALLTLATFGPGAPGDAGALGRAAVGGVALFVVYLVLAVAHPGGMGFGDVKLAGVLGTYLGWYGWGSLVVGFFTAFLVGGVVGLVLVLTRRANRKTSVPFGPYMFVGAAVGIAVGEQVWRAYLGML